MKGAIIWLVIIGVVIACSQPPSALSPKIDDNITIRIKGDENKVIIKTDSL